MYVQTHCQDTYKVHHQMVHNCEVVVQFLQTEMDQTFQDLWKFAMTWMNAQNPKILVTSTNMKDLLITRIVI
jgi:hypothetical protein